MGITHEFLVPDVDLPKVYFDCLNHVGNPFVACSGFMNFGEELWVEFQFKRTQFENWQEFTSAVLKLLESFKEDAAR